MGKVRIVGGGLTGIVAALQAHRLGCRDIELYEQYGQLGGALLPRTDRGLELRLSPYYFGGRNDPTRALLEWHGVAFDDFEEQVASVSPGPAREPQFVEGFAGPALAARQTALEEPSGESLADRLRAYPSEIEQALARYCQWSLGVWLDEVHASAAEPLGLSRVWPRHSDATMLAELKRADALYDGLYGLPRHIWSGSGNARAALPRDGFAGLFSAAGRALAGLGVKIHLETLVSPREAIADCRAGDALVWAAAPAALYKPMRLPAPKPIHKSMATYVFKAEGPGPLRLRNFTSLGCVARVSTYKTHGETLLTAECVTEVKDSALRREIRGLMSGFGGVELGEQLLSTVELRGDYMSMAEARSLQMLTAKLQQASGGAFVPGCWPGGLGHDGLAADLKAALEPADPAKTASAA
ncbi:MAG: NAD(P)-binding protein [Phenylobacterium sp.]